MTSDDEFTHRLIGFGLSEKEAQLYLTLTSLIDKGMVRPSLGSPTVYTAVDLDTALGSALQKQQSELREMGERKRELQELSQQQRFRPSDEVSTFKIIKSIKELIAVAMPLIDSMQEEWLIAAPAYLTIVASLFGVNEARMNLSSAGGRCGPSSTFRTKLLSRCEK